jgi:hypothetical protein
MLRDYLTDEYVLYVGSLPRRDRYKEVGRTLALTISKRQAIATWVYHEQVLSPTIRLGRADDLVRSQEPYIRTRAMRTVLVPTTEPAVIRSTQNPSSDDAMASREFNLEKNRLLSRVKQEQERNCDEGKTDSKTQYRVLN